MLSHKISTVVYTFPFTNNRALKTYTDPYEGKDTLSLLKFTFWENIWNQNISYKYVVDCGSLLKESIL